MNRPNIQNLRAPRSGFTLLELLAVITIISILLALILPAIGGAMRNARNAEVSAEFTRLTTSITSFKAEYNLEPWSEILLPENWVATPCTATSRTRIRRIWPQFNFEPRDGSGNPIFFDFNGDGLFTGDPNRADDAVFLNGSECLVFFLGGMRTMQPDVGLIGFSKNPINPFTRAGENRTIPHEFKPDQLSDVDGDGMLDYMDSLPDQRTPILYVSSNNGQGYLKSDGNLNFYVEADGKTPWKKSSFQLISPGEDGEFGFEPIIDTGNPPLGLPQPYSEDTDVPRDQADNICNFNPGGTLG
ncbi:MAG: prepilin-type N-terminal cleavage/methylation domain-containing protein [Fuerstiella sp.]